MASEEDMRERLARIEAHQSHLSAQMDRVVQLLDRLVRVEEHVAEQSRDMTRLYKRLEAAEQELSTWKSTRKGIVWVIGVAGTIIAAVMAITGSK